ncbi:Putative trafficking protein particle complex subunit 13 [Septoria linicola]|uniref:Trafficking protein particle complex subunit 13 n=1 Tax=Septoria linicola TaxID=215465 RepID=A0A9Q9ERF1_9PEZI|nr:putative trafficking protein particle complex subunit 13 [Septoria linicola]USW58503.1 Putative trafficking protein particle complex subunit 13 [Septoria linicola]
MAAIQHGRARSGTVSGPHSLSLKVLRLSRPTLAAQAPLPHTAFGNGLDIAPNASLASPSAVEDSTFPLTAALTLPAAFGAAYVGETFTCTLCVNNELPTGEGAGRKTVSGIRLIAELQTPSRPDSSIPLELENGGTSHGGEKVEEESLPPGSTLQRTLRHELKDEGPHVLAVTVSYTETVHTPDGAAASGGRARTFRKLYQFVSQQLLAVRSKVTQRKRRETDAPREWVLEAQLENVGEASIVLEKVWLKEKEGVVGKAMNGDEEGEATVLKPQDIEQIMFLVKETAGGETEEDAAGKTVLGQLNIDWRSAMGEQGSLTTGWLASRGR